MINPLEGLLGIGIKKIFSGCECAVGRKQVTRDRVTIVWSNGETETITSDYKNEGKFIRLTDTEIRIVTEINHENALQVSRRIPLTSVREYTYESLETESAPDISFKCDLILKEDKSVVSTATIQAECGCQVESLAYDYFLKNVFTDDNRPSTEEFNNLYNIDFEELGEEF